LEAEEEDLVRRTREQVEVLPAVRGSANLRSDLASGRWILQTLVGRFLATIKYPWRHRGIESRSTRRVRVHVGSDLHPLAPSVLDHRDRLLHLGPVGSTGRLQVIDLGWKAGFAADPYGLLNRLDELIAFTAHVGRVLALVLRGDLA